MSCPIITLLTDFGLRDSYVAQMKGVILGINPDATLIDVTHAFGPQDVLRAALVLCDSVPAFPEGTIHVVVVDPGVGTARRILAVEMQKQRFLAPDNGVLSLLFRRGRPERVIAVNRPEYWRQPVSSTFHGRDIFAPVAAHWSRGVDVAEFGGSVTGELAELTLPEPRRERGGIEGEVILVDAFGNLVTNIDETLLDSLAEHERGELVVEVGSQQIRGVHRCYGDQPAGSLLALVGSSGRLEIAVNGGSAAKALGVDCGAPVRIGRRSAISQSE